MSYGHDREGLSITTEIIRSTNATEVQPENTKLSKYKVVKKCVVKRQSIVQKCVVNMHYQLTAAAAGFGFLNGGDRTGHSQCFGFRDLGNHSRVLLADGRHGFTDQ